MGAVSKESDAGRAPAESVSGLLGGLIGDDFGVDDVMNTAKKFF